MEEGTLPRHFISMEEPKVITIDDVFDSTVMHINDFPRPNSTLGPGSDAVLHMSRIEFNEIKFM